MRRSSEVLGRLTTLVSVLPFANISRRLCSGHASQPRDRRARHARETGQGPSIHRSMSTVSSTRTDNTESGHTAYLPLTALARSLHSMDRAGRVMRDFGTASGLKLIPPSSTQLQPCIKHTRCYRLWIPDDMEPVENPLKKLIYASFISTSFFRCPGGRGGRGGGERPSPPFPPPLTPCFPPHRQRRGTL